MSTGLFIHLTTVYMSFPAALWVLWRSRPTCQERGMGFTSYESRHEKTCLRGLRPVKTNYLHSWRDLGRVLKLAILSRGIILSRQWTIKALFSLRILHWSAPLLFAYGINRFSHDVAHILFALVGLFAYHPNCILGTDSSGKVLDQELIDKKIHFSIIFLSHFSQVWNLPP